MIGLYLSGTGNTRYCVEYLLRLLDETAEAVPIEEENAAERAAAHSSIVLVYPIQYSNAPLMVRAFIRDHAELWRGKQVLCLATMGAFSGDGAGCAARILKRCGAAVTGGLHLRMPDSVCDSEATKKPLEENRKIVKAAEKRCGARILAEDFPRDGLGLPAASQTCWAAPLVLRQDGAIPMGPNSAGRASAAASAKGSAPCATFRKTEGPCRAAHHVLPLHQPLPAEGHHPPREGSHRTVPHRKLPVE
ncbi:MAG: flavodoxin domain-containing protein [Anaerotruncus massiliensis (ex Togo et al. 2019)]